MRFTLSTVAAGAATFSLLVSVQSAQSTADYRKLDNTEGPFVNVNTFPVRPMAISPDEAHLWTVDHHANEVHRFVLYDPADPIGETLVPDGTFAAPWDPVSIAYWEGPDGSASTADDEVLVVGSGSWGVMALTADTGEVSRFIQLRPDHTLPNGFDARIGRMAQPADILVDASTGMAFVSCPGADSVVQIDLTPGLASPVVRVFHEQAGDDFVCKRPLFLSWEDESASSGSILVAPLHSGNNSAWKGTLTGGNEVADLADPLVEDPSDGQQGLPDQDLFRIVPWENAGQPGSVAPVALARDMGTILFQHGVNPKDGRFWQLNTEAINKHPDLQTEPRLNGVFSHNRISILDFADPTEGPEQVLHLDPTEMLDAADTGVSTNITPSTTVGQPFGLEFNPDGVAFVSGLLTDNVMAFDKNGLTLLEWDVLPEATAPPGRRTNPRGILLRERESLRRGRVLVYCWGDNSIREYYYVFSGAASATEHARYDLGVDPTPPAVRRGRDLFFDGTNSRFGNLSCASCHVEGGTDLLVWNLSDNPRFANPSATNPDIAKDNKAGMVTQTLVGIENTPPFHWRGERELVDFNGAFAGLLGGEELTAAEFDDFASFVLSQRNPANANANRERLVDSSISFVEDGASGTGTDAVQGQELFDDVVVFRQRNTCESCHMLPTGTSNDPSEELPGSTRPRLSSRVPTHFQGLLDSRGAQTGTTIQIFGQANPREVAYLGAGVLHAGTSPDLAQFVPSITAATSHGTEIENGGDIAAFIHQFDQGLNLANHYGFALDASTHSLALTELAYLAAMQSAVRANVESQTDIAVLGSVFDGNQLVSSRWWYDGTLAAYVPDDPALGTRTLNDFLDGAANDGERTLFLGVPLGMGEAFAIDHDMDGLRNAVDPTPWTYSPSGLDAVAPGFVRAPQVLWTTTRAGRVRFETDEPTRATVRYRRSGLGAPWSEVSTDPSVPSKVHSVLLVDLHASTSFGAVNPAGYQDGGFPAVSMAYEVEVDVFDSSSNSTTMALAGGLTTRPHVDALAPEPAPPNTLTDPATLLEARHIHMQHVLTDLTMAPLAGNIGPIDIVVTATVAYQRGGDYDLNGDFQPPPASNRVLIGRLLRKRYDPVDDVDYVDNLPVTVDPAETWKVDEVNLSVAPGSKLGTGGLRHGGQFLVGRELSDGNGQVQVRAAVNPGQLQDGDEVVFVVDGVVEIPDAAAWASWPDPGTALSLPTELPMFPAGGNNGTYAFTRWNFPATGEANSCVSRTYSPPTPILK